MLVGISLGEVGSDPLTWMGLGVNGLGLGHFPDPGVTKGLNIGGAVFSNILMTVLICSRCCSINEILIFCRQKKKKKGNIIFFMNILLRMIVLV